MTEDDGSCSPERNEGSYRTENTMNEAKQSLRTLEQSCNLLQQQQVTFITALERSRLNANDRIQPVRNLAQVRHYLDNYCHNSTDKRILSLFLDICSELADFCITLDELQSDTSSSEGLVEESFNLLSPTNDLSGLRAKYPHDVVNHLSCDEAKNFYGGVVSLIPIVLDKISEAVACMEKPQPHTQQHPIDSTSQQNKQSETEDRFEWNVHIHSDLSNEDVLKESRLQKPRDG
ncbi:sperm acrosome-associated protein 9 [Rhinophrynus dorsalis]